MTACATLRASRPAGRRLLAERIWSHMWRLDELAEGPGRARSTCCVTTTRCRASDAAMDARDLSFYLYSLFKAGALARVCGGLQTEGSTPWGRKMGRRRCRGDNRWRDDPREPAGFDRRQRRRQRGSREEGKDTGRGGFGRPGAGRRETARTAHATYHRRIQFTVRQRYYVYHWRTGLLFGIRKLASLHRI